MSTHARGVVVGTLWYKSVSPPVDFGLSAMAEDTGFAVEKVLVTNKWCNVERMYFSPRGS